VTAVRRDIIKVTPVEWYISKAQRSARNTPVRSAFSSFRPATDIMYENDSQTTPTCAARTMTALIHENTAVGSRPETIFIRARK
jgi:hypothetical protein